MLDATLGRVAGIDPESGALDELMRSGMEWQTAANMLWSFGALGLAASLLGPVLFQPLLDGVLARMASQGIQGVPGDLRQELRYAVRRWPRLVMVKLLLASVAIATLGVAVGIVVLAVMSAGLLGPATSATSSPPSGPAVGLVGLMVLMIVVIAVAIIALATRLGLVTQVIIVEDQGVMGSIRRSWELTQGQIWRLIGYGILLVIVVWPVSLFAGLLGAALPWIGEVNIEGWIATPFTAIANTLIFYGLRTEQARYTSSSAPAGPEPAMPLA